MLWSILFYPVVPFDYSLQAGRSGVHSRVVPSTRHTLGPRDAVRRYLGLVSPVCCGCDVRVEPRIGHFGHYYIYTDVSYANAFRTRVRMTLRAVRSIGDAAAGSSRSRRSALSIRVVLLPLAPSMTFIWSCNLFPLNFV